MRWVNALPLLCLLACSDAPPWPEQVGLQLSVEDVTCTEAWLRVVVPAAPQGRTIDVVRDGARVQQIHLFSSDTVIMDEGLLPNRSYAYQVFRLEGGRAVEASLPISGTTMDTTSHSFTWEVTTLGDGYSSELQDVTIINDTLAYAVGAIYLQDSLGNWDPHAYNTTLWNGQSWRLMRIPFIGPCSAVEFPPLTAIWAFSSSEILVTNGGSVVRFDGTNATMDCGLNPLLTGAINKFWANDGYDVYAVGNIGTIVRYANGTWQKLESGTTLDITDIYGARSHSDGSVEILAVASKYLVNYDRSILRLSGTAASVLPDTPINSSLRGVWFVPGLHYYVVGDGVYEKKSLQEAAWRNRPLEIAAYYSFAIRGTAVNNVFVTGAFGEILHFNGHTWRSYLSQTGLPGGGYSALSVYGNQVIAVGITSAGGAVIAQGTRAD